MPTTNPDAEPHNAPNLIAEDQRLAAAELDATAPALTRGERRAQRREQQDARKRDIRERRAEIRRAQHENRPGDGGNKVGETAGLPGSSTDKWYGHPEASQHNAERQAASNAQGVKETQLGGAAVGDAPKHKATDAGIARDFKAEGATTEAAAATSSAPPKPQPPEPRGRLATGSAPPKPQPPSGAEAERMGAAADAEARANAERRAADEHPTPSEPTSRRRGG